jgi:hypothetical protein
MWTHFARLPRRSAGSSALAAAILTTALVATAACSVVVAGPNLLIVIGPWGGDHVRLDLQEAGGTLEYDCAYGTIEPGWTLTDEGQFTGSGEHFIEHGGPVQEGEVIPPRPASYSGTVDGDRMDLTVTLTDSAQAIGPFTLQRGSEGQILRCL